MSAMGAHSAPKFSRYFDAQSQKYLIALPSFRNRLDCYMPGPRFAQHAPAQRLTQHAPALRMCSGGSRVGWLIRPHPTKRLNPADGSARVR